MALRQSEHCRIDQQQVIVVVMHRLRQILRGLQREMRAAKDVIVSLRLIVRLVAPTGDDQKRVPFRRTGGIKRLLRVRLVYFLSSRPC